MKFDVLILGSDFNAYFMSRCYHEIYNKKVDVISKRAIGVVSAPSAHSARRPRRDGRRRSLRQCEQRPRACALRSQASAS